MTKVFKTREEILNRFKDTDESVGLVPTMGNLHQGHLNLLETSLRENEVTVISIFVNPTQFSANEDLANYPRTFENDYKKIDELTKKYNKEVVIFHPLTQEEVYEKEYKLLSVRRYEDILEGDLRPTHFKGVITVVKFLFDLVRPDKAYFGKKDYQQLIVVKDMVEAYNIDTDIVPIEICREKSGLAMSSRNNYLSLEQKKDALVLRNTLLQASDILSKEGLSPAVSFCQTAKEELGFNYLEIRNKNTFMPAKHNDNEYVIVGNYQIGTTRLLDNIEVSTNEL